MADDRSLKDVLRFLDPSGDMSDADIAHVGQELKFTEVLDLVTKVGEDDVDGARNILSKYDDRFTIAKEYSSVPTTNMKGSSFTPIGPVGSTSGKPAGSTSGSMLTKPMSRGQGDITGDDTEGSELDTALQDPRTKNRPEVRQIQSLLKRMKK